MGTYAGNTLFSKIWPAKSRARRHRPATKGLPSHAIHQNLATGPKITCNHLSSIRAHGRFLIEPYKNAQPISEHEIIRGISTLLKQSTKCNNFFKKWNFIIRSLTFITDFYNFAHMEVCQNELHQGRIPVWHLISLPLIKLSPTVTLYWCML